MSPLFCDRGFVMIKKGLKVKVLSGRDKKKEGEVIEIDRKNNRADIKTPKRSKHANVLVRFLIRI